MPLALHLEADPLSWPQRLSVFTLASEAKDLANEAKANDLTTQARAKGLTSKRPSIVCTYVSK